MKKSTLIMILSLVLAVALGVGGTLAYLTDEDGDINVMTVGYVTITQNEQERVEIGNPEAGLDEFTQKKAMNPAVIKNHSHKEPIDANGWEVEIRDQVKNYVDKIVSVTNTGANDAYVRTIFAFPEAGDFDTTYKANEQWLHWNGVSDTDTTPANGWIWGKDKTTEWPGNTDNWDVYENVEIKGKIYDIYIATNKNVLAPKGTTAPSLLGMFIDEKVDCDVNPTTGEKNYTFGTYNLGDISTLDVLVLSQAVQADGFDTAWEAFDAAFPTTKENLVEWLSNIEPGTPGDKNDTNNPPEFAPAVGDDDEVTFDVPADAYRVTNTAELEAAVAAGETTILLADGEYNADMNATTGKTLTLYGESKNAVLKSTKEGGEGADYDFDGSTVTFNGLTLDTSSHSGSFKGYARMNGTYNDCVIIGEYCLYGDAEFNYCTLNTTGDIYNIRTWGAPVATFDHCTFNSDGKAMLLYGTANTKLTLENCVFNDTGVLPDLKAAIEIGDDYGKSYELIVNNVVVNGYEENDKGIPTGTTLWANKNSMGTDKLNVVVDGVEIY